ncbi:MAG: acyl-CoA dehydrogenase family protein, partial [Mesorhizobium sp.]
MKMMDKAWVPSRGSGLPWVAGEYELLRDQVRRFVEEEIKPCADRWEEDGFIPRKVLRRMGELGFFGIRYPAEYGGAEMDAVASTVFAEELGRSTFGGAADAMLVHS